MSLAAYTKLGWANNIPPYINGPNLDKMDQQIKDLTDWALALTGMPAGLSLDAVGDTAPSGTLPEDGSVILRTGANARLFAYVGTKYGAGDGSTTFQLDDKRGRHTVGKGTHTDVDTVGKNEGGSVGGGLAVGSRRVKHKHTITRTVNTAVSDPGHGHTSDDGQGFWGVGGNAGATFQTTSGVFNPHGTQVASATTGITIGTQPVFTVGPQSGSEPTDGPAYSVTLKVVTL